MANNVARNWLFCLSKRGDSDVQIRELGDSSTDGIEANHRIANLGRRQGRMFYGVKEGGWGGLFPTSQTTKM